MERGLRAKLPVYDDYSGFTSYLSFEDEEIGEYNAELLKDIITDEEVNELFK